MKKSRMPEMVRENIASVHEINTHLYGHHCKDCFEAGEVEAIERELELLRKKFRKRVKK